MKTTESQYWRSGSVIAADQGDEVLSRQAAGQIGCASSELGQWPAVVAWRHPLDVNDRLWSPVLVECHHPLHNDSVVPQRSELLVPRVAVEAAPHRQVRPVLAQPGPDHPSLGCV